MKLILIMASQGLCRYVSEEHMKQRYMQSGPIQEEQWKHVAYQECEKEKDPVYVVEVKHIYKPTVTIEHVPADKP